MTLISTGTGEPCTVIAINYIILKCQSMAEEKAEKHRTRTSTNTSFYLPDSFTPILSEFHELCKREGESASQNIYDWITNYVRIHGTILNPQRPMNGFLEKGVPRVQVPVPDRPMPDHWHMTDQELVSMYKSPRTRFTDRMIIRAVLDKRRIKVKVLL